MGETALARLDVESDEQYYLLLGFARQPHPRSLRRYALDVSLTWSRAKELARKYRWHARLAVFDNWSAETFRVAYETELVTAAKTSAQKRAAAIEALLDVALINAERMRATAQSATVETLRPRDVVATLDAAVKLGRLEDGQSTENISLDLTHLSVEELRQLKALQGKAKESNK